jgi:hypothetical protein
VLLRKRAAEAKPNAGPKVELKATAKWNSNAAGNATADAAVAAARSTERAGAGRCEFSGHRWKAWNKEGDVPFAVWCSGP